MAGGGPEAGAGDALGDDVAGQRGASIEPRVPSSGALRTEVATVAAIRWTSFGREDERYHPLRLTPLGCISEPVWAHSTNYKEKLATSR